MLRRQAGSVLVGVVLLAAGMMFAVSAQTARGTDLRSDGRDLAGLIRSEAGRADARLAQVEALRAEVDALTDEVAQRSSLVAGVTDETAPLLPVAGLQPVRGPGLRISLDDAPRDLPGRESWGPNDLVVHQQDVQAVVNALWAGGAEAMQLMDQRVISTSAVRCVGNTLFLQGRVYSPPYVVTAVGDVAGMQAALDSSPGVAEYLWYVENAGLGYSLEDVGTVQLPAYEGSLELQHARLPEDAELSAASQARGDLPPQVTR
jgi:uncharacterized protein YlxW (UPF0749 family)